MTITVATLESVAIVLVKVQDRETRDNAFGTLLKASGISLTSNITKYIFKQEHIARCLH